MILKKQKNNKKGVVSKIFVFVFSIIIIIFAGFIVTKFIFNFSKNVESRLEINFYKNLKNDYASVYRTYGAEKVVSYKIQNDIKYICFINSETCIDEAVSNSELETEITNFNKEELQKILKTEDNIIIFDKNGIRNTYKIGKYKTENGCFCLKPKNGKIDIIIENNKNQVYLSKLEN